MIPPGSSRVAASAMTARPAVRRRRPRLAGWAALLVLLCAGCRRPDPQGSLVRAWAEGPARWLLLAEDHRTLDRLRPGEWSLFLERFWSRRARLAPLFEARVAAADSLYAETGVRGSLTDRGGALILLGAPRHLRVGEITVPNPRGPEGRARSARLPAETWIYDRDELDPHLRALLEGSTGESPDVAELVFLSEGRRTRLVYGREVLALAARAWVDS